MGTNGGASESSGNDLRHGRAVGMACGSTCCSVRRTGQALERAICEQNAHVPSVHTVRKRHM